MVKAGKNISLSLNGIQVHYGKAEAIGGVSMDVREGSVTGIIGANGAGKSTLLKTISGLLKASAGEIWFFDDRIDRLEPYQIVQRGIVQVPEGRRLFPQMSVQGNIRIGAYLRRDKADVAKDMEKVFERFPVLRSRLTQTAQTLSGGEQQMVAISRALMARPRLLLMDEPSWGLAPLMVDELAGTIRHINQEGISILLVEQNAGLALELTEYGYVLEVGRLLLEGKIGEIMSSGIFREAFLG